MPTNLNFKGSWKDSCTKVSNNSSNLTSVCNSGIKYNEATTTDSGFYYKKTSINFLSCPIDSVTTTSSNNTTTTTNNYYLQNINGVLTCCNDTNC
jgi:hypothetical protein